MHILILGGTSEAGALAGALGARGVRATLSYAGRTRAPRPPPPGVAMRVGGFGGAAGLAEWARAHGVSHIVDATHPFAAQISQNAAIAAPIAGAELIALGRLPWLPEPGDDWREVADIAAAIDALGLAPRRVFLATGRQSLGEFARAPQHHYLVRLVDEPTRPLPLPHCVAEIARGPFDVATDTELLRRHGIEMVVSKNAGGSAARAKLVAARTLGLPVVMIARPAMPARREVFSVADVLRALGHGADLGV